MIELKIMAAQRKAEKAATWAAWMKAEEELDRLWDQLLFPPPKTPTGVAALAWVVAAAAFAAGCWAGLWW